VVLPFIPRADWIIGMLVDEGRRFSELADKRVFLVVGGAVVMVCSRARSSETAFLRGLLDAALLDADATGGPGADCSDASLLCPRIPFSDDGPRLNAFPLGFDLSYANPNPLRFSFDPVPSPFALVATTLVAPPALPGPTDRSDLHNCWFSFSRCSFSSLTLASCATSSL
jgi:hypothetical protein